MKPINFKLMLMHKGLNQITLARKLGVNHSLLSLQMNNHRLLPKKYMPQFCKIMELDECDIVKNFKENK